MKTWICCLSLLAYLLPVQANTSPSEALRASTTLLKENVLYLSLDNLKNVKTKILLTSLRPKQVHHVQLLKNRARFTGKLNLSELEDGRYVLTIKNSDGEQLQQVLYIKENKVLFSAFT